MDKLRFGTAGVPASAKGRSTEHGINRVAELGLDCMEMEFVHGVRMKEDMASGLSSLARGVDVVLTAHGPYYINLNSREEEKRVASRERILRTARIAGMAGGWSITFHAAFLMKMPPEEVQTTVRQQMQTIMDTLKGEDNDIWIRPETTGKHSQWGTLEQILELCQEWPRVGPCIDFAHLYAYGRGEPNTYEGFVSVLDDAEAALGPGALKEMHIHVSGIEYGPKGERKHLVLEDSALDHEALMRALRDYDVAGCLICESPNLEDDALRLKAIFEGG